MQEDNKNPAEAVLPDDENLDDDGNPHIIDEETNKKNNEDGAKDYIPVGPEVIDKINESEKVIRE